MAVEIRELVIKTSVTEANLVKDSQTAEAAGNRKLINTCVAEVLKILQREKER